MAFNPPSIDVEEYDEKYLSDFEELLLDEYSSDIEHLVEEFSSRNCSVTVDWKELRNKNMELADKIKENPNPIVRNSIGLAFHNAILNIAGDEAPPEEEIQESYIRFENFDSKDIRDIRSDDLNQYFEFSGVVSKRTEVNMKLQRAKFQCQYCYNEIPEVFEQEGEQLRTPNECPVEHCNNTSNFKIMYDHHKTDFIDSQLVKLQERPEGLTGGDRPADIEVKIEGDITGGLNAGDRVKVNGIIRPDTGGQDEETIHSIILECSSFVREDTDFEDIDLEEDDIQEIRDLIESYDNPLTAVVDSIAPSIHGYGKIKRAIALQLFGGVSKELDDGSTKRGDIHILLIGDPGTGKSELLQYVDSIAPRSVYSSGKGASSAGLTAAAVRDDFGDGQEWTLEAGALVLADKGLAAIDEIDKMRSEDRSAMHEALEQQEISVAKAGINATLKSRCSLLAAANPAYGRFDPLEPVATQINLEPPLVSRFDLIFTMQDEPDAGEEDSTDEALADHIVETHSLGQHQEAKRREQDGLGERNTSEDAQVEPEIDPDMFRKYIAYAQQIVPQNSEEAKETIKQMYLELRQGDSDEQSPVSITPRQIEAAIRLAEARARLSLRTKVTERDAKAAVTLIHSTLAEVGFDSETGEMDIDKMQGNVSHSQRQKINSVRGAVRELVEDTEDDIFSVEEVQDTLEDDMSTNEIKQRIQKMKQAGDLYQPKECDKNEYKKI